MGVNKSFKTFICVFKTFLCVPGLLPNNLQIKHT